MALWQYDIFLIPNEKYNDLSKCTEEVESDLSIFDDSALWKDRNMLISTFDNIKSFLGIGKSWNNDLLVFGDLETNCVKVLMKEDVVCSLTIRIDFRKDFTKFLQEVIKFCKQNKLIMLTETLFVLPNDIEIVRHYITQSKQVEKYKSLT